MKKILILFFLVFLSLYSELGYKYKSSKTYTTNNNGDFVILGKVGDWTYKQFTTSKGVKTEFFLFDNINNAKIGIDFGENSNEIYISISSKKIKQDIKYFLHISNNTYNSDYIIDYLKDKNISIVNGILSISDKTAHDLILYKFMKYDTITLYDSKETPEKIITFNLKGLERVFRKLEIIPNS